MKKNLIIVLIFTLFLCLIFINKDSVNIAAINSLIIWQNKLFPSLFIMFIIQDILITYNASYFINLILNNLFSKLFGLSINGQMAFTLSLISGSPSNAFMLSEFCKQNKLTKEEANHILMFSYFANPLFLYSMLTLIFSSTTIALKIIFSLYLSNFILGISIKKNKYTSTYSNEKTSIDLGTSLSSAIKKSMNTLIIILGTVAFFMILSQIISIYINNDMVNTIISGFLEITNGLNLLINLDVLNYFKEIIAIFIISFGGLSVHLQIFSIIKETDLSYKSFFEGRVLATIIAILIIILL